MSEPELDVVAIGSAIVDVLAHTDDAFIEAHSLVKGTMALIDAAGAESLYAELGPAVEASGGAAANTVAGVASFGGRAGFVGKVRDDQLGAVFAHDIRAAGVEYATPFAGSGPATGRCLVLITPDAQRTMNTFLGAAVGLAVADIDPAFIASGAVLFLEGYLWDPPEAISALRVAIDAAESAGRTVAFSLSDPFCVERHRDEFLSLCADHVGLLFANEHEATAMFQTDSLDVALKSLRELSPVVVVTRGPAGSVVLSGGERVDVPAVAGVEVVDTTGAGDLYAAGFLYGYVRRESRRLRGAPSWAAWPRPR
jgi:sugar/nucleoside kinase (ribokinase family)